MRPSIGHATIYVAVNAVVVQGPRVALSAIAGPAAVAIFGIYGTLVQSIAHITNLIMPVLQLEFARNSGSEDRASASREMVIHGSRFAVANYLGVAAVILLTSPFVIPVWTSHKIAFDGGLLGIMLATSFFTQFGRSALSYLMGHNAVFLPALAMLLLGLGGLGVGSMLTPRFYVTGMGAGFLVSEALTAGVILMFAARHLNASLLPFVREQLDLFAGARELSRALKEHRHRLAALRLRPSRENRA